MPMTTVKDQLREFCAQEGLLVRNLWLEEDKFKVYVRKEYRYLSPKERICCLGIANISVDDKYQRQGTFKKFLDDCFELCQWDAVFIECIHNPHLVKYLQKNNWTPFPTTPISFYKRTNLDDQTEAT